MAHKRVHFMSLGCAKNRIDTETMLASLLGGAGGGAHRVVEDPLDADVVVVNTCAFVEDAKVESIDAILDMGRLRASGDIKKLVVAGCLSQRYADDLVAEMPEVDHFLGTADLDQLPALLDGSSDRQVVVGQPDRRDFDWEAPRVNSMPPHTAYLKIAEGCSNRCAFCIIPTLRGPQRSRSVASIAAEARSLVSNGVVELNLIAQDLTAYGLDLRPRLQLTDLLRSLEDVDGLRWVRLLYAYPRRFPEGLLELMADSSKIVPYIDMPVQHYSDSVLRRMGRGTTAEIIGRRVGELREKVPGIAIRTTVLVGFPGETDADFEILLDFVRKAKFERLGGFAYSREEGTTSYDMGDQVPAEVATDRLDTLMSEQREISLALNRTQIGTRVEVLVEGPNDDSASVWTGRTAQQAPEIDGETYLVNPMEAGPIRSGQLVCARVTEVSDYDLIAEPVGA